MQKEVFKTSLYFYYVNKNLKVSDVCMYCIFEFLVNFFGGGNVCENLTDYLLCL